MNIKLLAFCFRSLWQEYGVAFLARVVLAHPLATMRGIARYRQGPFSAAARWRGGPASLVGVGFCLKPLDPPCPSGRANHRCVFFEPGAAADFAPCQDCLIRSTGQQALAAGSAFYVMTSAHDILHDVLLPALARRRFRRAVLTMCRFSFEPVRLALAMCGIDAQLFAFQHGDCRDYSTWRRADTGDKPERTLLDAASLATLITTLSGAAGNTPAGQFRRAGNIYEPC